jgi:hypothetical protein
LGRRPVQFIIVKLALLCTVLCLKATLTRWETGYGEEDLLIEAILTLPSALYDPDDELEALENRQKEAEKERPK